MATVFLQQRLRRVSASDAVRMEVGQGEENMDGMEFGTAHVTAPSGPSFEGSDDGLRRVLWSSSQHSDVKAGAIGANRRRSEDIKMYRTACEAGVWDEDAVVREEDARALVYLIRSEMTVLRL